MPSYEHVFIARQDLSQAQVDALAEGITNIVTEFKGQVHKTETWGLKQLAYKIQKNRKGHYAVSYTHLDVYKGQSSQRAARRFQDRIAAAIKAARPKNSPGSNARASPFSRRTAAVRKPARFWWRPQLLSLIHI